MGKQLTASDYKKKFTELRAKQRRLHEDVADRLFALCQANPDVVIRQWHSMKFTAKEIHTRTTAGNIEIDTAMEYIATIEKHIVKQNPRRQLKLDLKDPK